MIPVKTIQGTLALVGVSEVAKFDRLVLMIAETPPAQRMKMHRRMMRAMEWLPLVLVRKWESERDNGWGD
jgi:hypothetical protein